MDIMEYHAVGGLENLIKQTNVNRATAFFVGAILSAIHTFIIVVYLSPYYSSTPFLVIGLPIWLMGLCSAYLVRRVFFYRVTKENKMLFMITICSLDELSFFSVNNPNSVLYLYKKLKFGTCFQYFMMFITATIFVAPDTALKVKEGFPFSSYIPYFEYLAISLWQGFWIFTTIEMINICYYWKHLYQEVQLEDDRRIEEKRKNANK